MVKHCPYCGKEKIERVGFTSYRKRWYALSGNSYVILKEKGYEEYKSKR